MPIIPATWEAGNLCEPRNSRPAWATKTASQHKYGNAQIIMHKDLCFKILPWLDEGSGGRNR